MKKILLLFFTLLSAPVLFAQNFTGTYTFDGVTNSSGKTDPTAVPVSTGLTYGSFTASTALPANPNASKRFSFIDQAVDLSPNNLTGTIDLTKYYEITITPASGYTINLSELAFIIQRSNTGIRQFAVRSSKDNYAANLPASVSPANTNLQVISDNIFQIADITNAQAGSKVSLTGLTNLSSAITFRFYGFNAKAAGGTFSLNSATLSGTAVSSSGNAPTLTLSNASLDFGGQALNVASGEKTYNLSGANLTNENITVTTVAPYSISKTSGSGFTTILTFSSSDFASESQTVYVKYLPTSAGLSNGSISNSGGGVTVPKSVSLTGTGESTALTVDQNSLDFGAQNVGTNSNPKTFNLSAAGLTDAVNLSVGAPFSLSKDNLSYSNSLSYTVADLASSKTVYVRFSPIVANILNANLSISSTGASPKNIALSGSGTLAAGNQADHVVISEVYGGGGNSGANYKYDFIELYNPTDAPVNLTNWSVQYASASSTANWAVTPLTGTIPAKGFYLIQGVGNGGGTLDLPTPDVTGTINVSATAGKVLLTNTPNFQTGALPSGSHIIDLVGFGGSNGYWGTGAAPAINNTSSLERKASATSTTKTLGLNGSEEFDGNGYDTKNNANDFVVQTIPNPQNTSVREPIGASHVVISQVYGAGGNSGATYKNDFVELYNPTLSAVNLTGWSVQYSAATNTNWAVTNLTGSIAPKTYYLVQLASGGAVGTNLPTADATGGTNMAAANGKVLLSNSTVPQSGAFPASAAVVDFVGYGSTANGYEGSAPTLPPTTTASVIRKASATANATTMGTDGPEEFMGNGYDSDDNASDFILTTPKPRNSSITAPPSKTGPYFILTPKSLAFGNQALNTNSAALNYIISSDNLTANTTVTASASFTISKTSNGTYSSTLTYTTAELATNQTVYVKFSPTAYGNVTGSISHVSIGAVTLNLALTGTGIDPNQTSFNFENCTVVGSPLLSDGFYQYSVAGPQTWGCTTTFGHDANDLTGAGSAGNALQISGYSGGNVQNEDWLISPALNLSSMNYAILSFWTRSAFAGDKLQLKLSTDYRGSGNPNTATWIDLDGKFPETASDVWTKSDNIDLTAYKSTPVYIAFIYNSTTSSASRWTLDDFEVTNSATPPAVDLTASIKNLDFGFQAAGTTSTERTFSFSPGNITGDVTVTAPGSFNISKTSGGTFSKTLTYNKAAVNNIAQTVYVNFSPNGVNKTFSENLSITTDGTGSKTVTLTGNTFDTANSLQVANWNIEWFGSPTMGPTNDDLQANNVRTVVNSINADIYGFAEVVDTTLFRNKVLPPGYGVIFSDFGSYADDKNDPDYDLAQKLAFMYRTDIIKPLKTFGVLRDTFNPAIPATSVDGTPYKNWSSGRFPFLMEAEVKINNKVDTVYFIEIHAKANTGATAAQIDSYNRRKDGNLQFKNWLDANLAGKKVLILGDFNDVLNADKTIAPMPAGTGTSYSDFTNDTENYFPITLPLSLGGKRSTAGFPTVIDNVIINKNLNVNYIPATAEVLESVKNLVASYTSTTTDHYPVKSRYVFGNGVPTLDVITDQAICYAATNQTIPLTGISPGPETNQTIQLSVSSDNPNMFDVLNIDANGSNKGTITYHLKNNVSGTANITVTVTDNGGTDFGGVDKISKTFKLNVKSSATAIISGTTAICLNGSAPNLTFTAANGTAPYTFTYNVNGGTNKTVTTTTANSVTVSAPTSTAGTFVYNLVSVNDVNCSQPQTGTATVTVRTLPTAQIGGTSSVSLNATSPLLTFTAANGTAPYTFTYNINGGTNKTVTTTAGNSVTVLAPTNTVGTFIYNLVSVNDANCTQVQSGTATITVRPLPTATVNGTTAICINGTQPIVTFTGSAGIAPYTFTYTLNGSTRSVTSSTNIATVNVSTNQAGIFNYSLVSVSDVNASQAQTGSAVITVNPLPVVNINSDKGISVSKGESIILTATGGTQYTWTGTDIVNGQNSSSLTIRPKQSGIYRVSVSNINGCTAEQSITINVTEDFKLEASTLLSPNGDGYNDKFIVKNIDYYPNNTIKIFDKTGRILYTQKSYSNNWDGTVNGSPLAEGTYYYIIDLGNNIGTFKGFINIIRN